MGKKKEKKTGTKSKLLAVTSPIITGFLSFTHVSNAFTRPVPAYKTENKTLELFSRTKSPKIEKGSSQKEKEKCKI